MSLSAGVLCVIGLFLTFMFFIDGLLNLGGCGDRIGKEYYVSNCIQTAVGLMGFIGIAGYML
ncbi:hypothetical protein PMW_73 [Pseudomonas phage phiPMW]|uniref:Uncharacterized protein n=1 Tax=Pseudomonas phage phiPMW TaxID=1815582 RepID=A0A1S5R1E4_9CAUD|nr:hypothetical protein FDG97_gp073 [Pseudomonas phage phiPMW]ANA49198.1 hypothetical protein PMW_73 [Pseudomonas phage phiPMW]